MLIEIAKRVDRRHFESGAGCRFGGGSGGDTGEEEMRQIPNRFRAAAGEMTCR